MRVLVDPFECVVMAGLGGTSDTGGGASGTGDGGPVGVVGSLVACGEAGPDRGLGDTTCSRLVGEVGVDRVKVCVNLEK